MLFKSNRDSGFVGIIQLKPKISKQILYIHARKPYEE